MTHPCATESPPSWCNKKRKRKKKRLATSGLSAVTPAQIRAHFKKHKVRKATKEECYTKGKKKKLKKGCFWGRAALKGTLLKKMK
jgi:hypothetical protein